MVHGREDKWFSLLSSETDFHESAALNEAIFTLSMTTGDFRNESIVLISKIINWNYQYWIFICWVYFVFGERKIVLGSCVLITIYLLFAKAKYVKSINELLIAGQVGLRGQFC